MLRPATVWIMRLSTLLLVVLWTVPTLGLLISSLRDRDQISQSGWWQSFGPIEQTGFVRSSTHAVWTASGYEITGNVLQPGQVLIAWGISARQPDAFLPGQIAPTRNGTLTVAADGAFRLISDQPVERGLRIFLTTQNPPSFTLSNYLRVLRAEGMGRAFLNTLTVTIPATVIPILVAAFAAYALAWMRFPGRAVLGALIVGALVIPLQVALIPLLRLHNTLGIGKGYLGIWLAHTGFGLPLAIFVLRNYMARLPVQLIDSARIDGASDFRIFCDIVLPLSFPAVASFAIFQFMWVWNDLLVATVFLGTSPSQLVMTAALREQMGSMGGEWEILATSAIISMAVPLLCFALMQRYLVRGLLSGSVDGV